MNIDIRNFVDINITHHSTASASSTREVTVLFTSYEIADDAKHNIYSSASELPTAFLSQTTDLPAIEYAKLYFLNGGRKLHIIYVNQTAPSGGTIADNLKAAIKLLSDDEIVVAYPASTSVLVTAMNALNSDSSFYGVKLKLAVVRTSDTVTISGNPAHVLAKYSTKGEVQAGIAAYLSKIDINRINSVKDYSFTVENLTLNGTDYYEDEDDTLLKSVINGNENVDMFLAGQIRNLGGNSKDGFDLVNEYMLIVIQQTVSEAILNVLVTKLKGESGIATIHTAMAQELTKYVSNGYLATDKVWKDEDLTIAYNGMTYTVIEQNTPLLLGYQIKILPYSSLTEEDKQKHKTPPIYLVIADSYGIRHVAVTGEVY